MDINGLASKQPNVTNIRFPLPVNKESDYDNSSKSVDRKKIKKHLKKTNDYYIHYPISSTESSSINSPALMHMRKNNYPFSINNHVNNIDKNKLQNFDSLCDINNQTESVLLNSYKLV